MYCSCICPPYWNTHKFSMATSEKAISKIIIYFQTLDCTAKARYLDKLKVVDNVDPYTMTSYSFSVDSAFLLFVIEANIYTYLVNTPSFYTKYEL